MNKIAFGLLLLSFHSFGQNTTAFVNSINQLIAFENGVQKTLFHQHVRKYDVGQNCVVWVTPQGESMFYHSNEITKIRDFELDFIVTDLFVGYKFANAVGVIDQGVDKLLCASTSEKQFGEEIIAWNDYFNESFQVYHNGKLDTLELRPAENFKVGENMLAYVNHQGYFKIMQDGMLYSIFNQGNAIKYQCGRNVVAFVDPMTEYFKVFENCETFNLEDFTPEKFVCGDNFVAYKNVMNELVVYCNQEKIVAENYAPDEFYVQDNMLVYNNQGRFIAWSEGVRYEVDLFFPEVYQVEKDQVAYLDQQQKLWLFKDGIKSKVSSQNCSFFLLRNHTLHYELNGVEDKVYFDGKSF